MKKVRLITTDEHNGKEAISRTPLRNKYFFAGQWHEIAVTVKPEILRDAHIIETVEAIYAELTDTFDIMALIEHVKCDTPNRMHEATIQRQLCQLRQYGKLNYKCIDEQKGLYQKLPVISKTCAEQVKIEFQPDMKKQFVEFLKKEDMYDAFMQNITNPNTREDNRSIIKTIENYFDECKSRNIIDKDLLCSAFRWVKSSIDVKYWIALDRKWQEVCK